MCLLRRPTQLRVMMGNRIALSVSNPQYGWSTSGPVASTKVVTLHNRNWRRRYDLVVLNVTSSQMKAKLYRRRWIVDVHSGASVFPNDPQAGDSDLSGHGKR